MTTKITYTDHENNAQPEVKKEEYTLSYDNRGYITGEIAYTNYSSAQTVNKTFTYDEIGRLEQAVIGSENNNYTYDKVGNRLTMNDGTSAFAYSYNQFNQLTAITKDSNNYMSYEYDGRGNQTQEVQYKYLSVKKQGNLNT